MDLQYDVPARSRFSATGADPEEETDRMIDQLTAASGDPLTNGGCLARCSLLCCTCTDAQRRRRRQYEQSLARRRGLADEFDALSSVHEMSGVIRGGRITAVTGASGAGKTHFLELLAFEREPSQGYVQITNKVLYWGAATSAAAAGRAVPSYKPPPVVFASEHQAWCESMSVWETIDFAVQMNNAPSAQNARLTSSLVELLYLSPCRHVAVKCLSDGQRRRMALAVALAAHPCVIVADGVTDGLNACEQLAVLRALRECAKRGFTVILGLGHADLAVLSMVDDVAVLADGYLLYLGPADAQACSTYFAKQLGVAAAADVAPSVHPVSVVIAELVSSTATRSRSALLARETGVSDDSKLLIVDSLSLTVEPIDLGDTKGAAAPTAAESQPMKSPKMLADAFRRYASTTPATAPVASSPSTLPDGAQVYQGKRPTAWVQSGLLFHRFWNTMWRRYSHVPKMMMALAACCMFAVIVWDRNATRTSTQTVLETGNFVWVTLFLTVSISHAKVGSWLEFRAVYLREQRQSLYSPAAYFVAHTFYSNMEVYTICVLYMLATWWAVFAHSSAWDVFVFWLYMCSHGAAHASLLEAIVFSVGDDLSSHALGMGVTGFSFLFSGILVPRSQMNAVARFFNNLSYTQYCFSGMMDLAFTAHDQVDELYGYRHHSVVVSVVSSIGIAVVCRTAFALALWRLDAKSFRKSMVRGTV